MKWSFVNFMLLLPLFLNAGEQIDLHQAYLDLKNDDVLMNISAHPDDEDGFTLSYYRMKYGVKTYSLFFTRGEGGQNEIGPELYADLGVIRSEETRKAAEIQGTEAFFLNLEDFGYSKMPEEAFEKWGGQTEVLRRLVYYIRKLRPDVMFTNHNTNTGHGHHQAVAITALAAFDAAADSTAFPEQLKLPGLTVWQPRKLFFRIFNRSGEHVDVINRTGEIDSARSVPYTEIAAHALQQHRSQGMDKSDAVRNPIAERFYKLVRTNQSYVPDSTTFFAGIDPLADVPGTGLKALSSSLKNLTSNVDRASLISQVSQLMHEIKVLRDTAHMPTAKRLLNGWNDKLQTLVRLACDIHLEVRVADPVLIPGQSTQFDVLVSSPNCKVVLTGSDFSLAPGWVAWKSTEGKNEEEPGNGLHYSIESSKEVSLTLPRSVAQYNPIEEDEVHRVHAHMLVDGKPATISASISVDVAPPYELTVTPEVAWIPEESEGEGKSFSFRIVNHYPHKTAGRIHVEVPAGWFADSAPFVIPAEDSIAVGSILVRPPHGMRSAEHEILFDAGSASASAVVKIFDIRVSEGMVLGIIQSYDNTIVSVAQEMNVPFQLLNEADLSTGDLSRFASIVVDMRAYAMRSDLRNYNGRLLEYVHNGGNLVVMYQKDQDWKPEYAPYHFTVTRKRVVEENSAMTELLPAHTLFTHPNSISPADWEGWVQERGMYFPGEAAPEYTRLLSTHDVNEDPLDTGYLVAAYGKGSYIYTTYVWYRQMKERHQGALKCFANMISYARFRP